jgi:exocyst complex component 4
VGLISFQFNAVELALSLLDDDSTGKDMNSFNATKDMLERALKGTIER